MKKLLFIFFAIIIILISSCENSSVPTINELEDVKENITATEQTETIAEFSGSSESEIAEIVEAVEIETEREWIYTAPYTADEIKDIFNEDKELFEKVKNIKMPDGYNYLIATPYKTELYNFSEINGAENNISYQIDEISEFFDKYENIFFIHLIDPDSAKYADENLIALFKLQVDIPTPDSDYIPWAEIRYNRNSGEIEEKITGEYIIIPLDEHWYYIYSNIWAE